MTVAVDHGGEAREALRVLLHAARRHCFLQELVFRLERALALAAGLALVLLVVHVTLVALPRGSTLAATALPALAALAAAWRYRPALAQAARWADSKLHCAGLLPTGLEFLLEARRPASTAAVAALERSLGRELPAAAARLAAEPVRRVPRTTLAAVTWLALAALPLVLPGRAAVQGAVSSPSAAGRYGAAISALAPAPANDLAPLAQELGAAARHASPRATAPEAPARPAGAAGAPVAGRSGAGPGSATARADLRRTGERAAATGGGHQAGASAADGSAARGEMAPVGLLAAFRDLRVGPEAPGAGRAGGSALELAAALRDPLDFDARQAALAGRAQPLEPPREPPRVADSAAATAVLARYQTYRGILQ